MSTYVTSDIHGCFNEFKLMLESINFSKEDKLYILGDVLDRGPNPLDTIDFIRQHDNIILIKGNHEEFYTYYYENKNYRSWHKNGGYTTLQQLEEKSEEYKKELYEYIKSLPIMKVVDNFILVHAGIYFPPNHNDMSIDEFLEQEEDICLWSRDNIGIPYQYKNYIVICGHTPVQTITENYDEAKILKEEGTIYIDCGCCFRKRFKGHLACLRLEDMKEFYI